MLNELYHVVTALEGRGVPLKMQHKALDPMGKNAALLLVKLADDGRVSEVEVVPKNEAGRMIRVKHGSAGSSFPGFNLPGPLRVLPDSMDKKTREDFEKLVKNRNAKSAKLLHSTKELFGLSDAVVYSNRQQSQFDRSVDELPGWLAEDLKTAPGELANISKLLEVVIKGKLDLDGFAGEVAAKLVDDTENFSQTDRKLFAEALFLKKGKIPVYLDLHLDDKSLLQAADPRLWEMLNEYLLKLDPPAYITKARQAFGKAKAKHAKKGPTPMADAFTGKACELPKTFPDPKVAKLGNVILFSNNTNEAGCFYRYGLGGSDTFPVSEQLANRMSGALLTLAHEDQVGKTCRGLPGLQKGKTDLLLVYLDEDPAAGDPYVDLFGGESNTHSDADYTALVAPLISALEAKVKVNPSQLLRVVGLTAVDKANKQISLHRSYTASEVLRAAREWTQAAGNVPPVTLTFFDKKTEKIAARSHAVPTPLDVLASVNHHWQLDGESSLAPVLRHGDAFDLLLNKPAAGAQRARLVLELILARQRPLFILTGRYKQLQDFKLLPDHARWQVLKSVGLLGILLNILNHHWKEFMKDTNYQVGRLLGLADSLHFQYCRLHRTSDEKLKSGHVDTPTELLGNALFGTALDNPVRAMSLLAQRLRPYHGWARTYGGKDAGLVHWFIRQLGDCEKQIDLEALKTQGRPNDIHKAELLLGYLADQGKCKNDKE